MQYPAIFSPAEEGGFVVTFRDIPEAITQGDDEAEAMDMAADALLTSMDFYFEKKRPVPLPSKPQHGERLVRLPLNVSAKVLLLNQMLARGVRQKELAERMGAKPQEVSRLMDLKYASKIDAIDEAMRALGARLEVVRAS